jgi:predicted phage terminase large subunit-like protein
VLFYKAHAGFDDFSDILWPEQFTESDLRKIRQGYIDDFDSSGYSQEYLNSPYDHNDAYFKQAWFVGMEGPDFNVEKRVFIGADFAISKADRANRSSFTVGGVDAGNFLHIFDQSVDRWSTDEIIDEMFRLQEVHNPEAFFVEDGVIWKALEPIILREMRIRNIYLNCVAMLSTKDKATRGRSLQKRMKARAVKFDKESQWYPGYEAEMLKFTGYSEAVADDQVDSTSILSRGVDELPILDEEDFMTEEELYYASEEPRNDQGRSKLTGY